MRFLPYENRFEPSFVQLLRGSFGMLSADPDTHIRWKFFDHPYASSNRICCAVDEAAEGATDVSASPCKTTIAGQYANVGRSFSRQGKEYPGYLCQDMCVHPDYRGRGLILGMSKPVYEDMPSGTFTIGFSNEQGVQVDRNSQEYGYKVIRELTTTYFPLLPFVGSLPTGWTFHEASSDEFRSLPFGSFRLFSERIRISHSSEYAVWRYADRPDSDYRYFVFSDANGNIVGYAVFRPTKRGISLIDFDATGTDAALAFRCCLATARSTGVRFL